MKSTLKFYKRNGLGIALSCLEPMNQENLKDFMFLHELIHAEDVLSLLFMLQ